jgi:hypothetical protein
MVILNVAVHLDNFTLWISNDIPLKIYGTFSV